MQLAEKVAIVTGGGGGIGGAICLGLASEGAKVVVCGVHQASAQETATRIGAPSIAIQADVSSPEDVDRMVAETVRQFGRLDILVNVAGIHPSSSMLDMDVADWDRVMAVNLRGVFLCTRAAARVMKAQGGGKIVTISSGRGFAGMDGGSGYAASKGGVNAFTASMGMELGPYGINVNAVCPGKTVKPRVAGALTDEQMKQHLKDPPNKRIGQPEDAVGPVIFLCSDASKTMFGQIVVMKTP